MSTKMCWNITNCSGFISPVAACHDSPDGPGCQVWGQDQAEVLALGHGVRLQNLEKGVVCQTLPAMSQRQLLNLQKKSTHVFAIFFY